MPLQEFFVYYLHLIWGKKKLQETLKIKYSGDLPSQKTPKCGNFACYCDVQII